MHGRIAAAMERLLTARWLRWIALLLICAAYVQGGLTKAWYFAGAIAEMQHFGLQPAAPMAVAVIVVELGAVLLILSGYRRWLGALVLAAFTVAATFVANRFWEAPASERAMMTNTFFEHLGLVGAFVLIAWHDLVGWAPKERR